MSKRGPNSFGEVSRACGQSKEISGSIKYKEILE